MKNTEFDINKITFADDESRAQYEAALRGDPLPVGVKNPMIVVTGEMPGVGKSMLIRSIIKHRFGVDAENWVTPESNRQWLASLNAIARRGVKYAWFDGVRRVKSNDLNRFLTCSSWNSRRLYSREFEEVDIKCTIFISGPVGCISDDLARRSRVIRLGEMPSAPDLREILGRGKVNMHSCPASVPNPRNGVEMRGWGRMVEMEERQAWEQQFSPALHQPILWMGQPQVELKGTDISRSCCSVLINGQWYTKVHNGSESAELNRRWEGKP